MTEPSEVRAGAPPRGCGLHSLPRPAARQPIAGPGSGARRGTAVASGLRRLEHEYSLAAELDPAWAAKPLALTRHEGRTILILKDPGGEPLDLVLERDKGNQGQPLDLTRFLRIAIGLAKALGQVHRHGLIHKDIKPANVLVDDAGNVWLTGFGIASRLPRERQAPSRRRSLPARSPTWRPNRPAA
jgi:serine/threonine protein kinase